MPNLHTDLAEGRAIPLTTGIITLADGSWLRVVKVKPRGIRPQVGRRSELNCAAQTM